MKNYFNYHLKRGFSSEMTESWSHYLREDPKKVQILIHLIISIITVAILLKLRSKHNFIYSNNLIDSLHSASLKVIRLDTGLQKLNDPHFNPYDLLINTDKMDQLFEGRFHSIVDYLGAYAGVKSMAVHQLFNMIWPKVFFGMSLFMGGMSYNKNPKFRIKKELSYFVSKLPRGLNWVYVFGPSIKKEYAPFKKIFWISLSFLFIITLTSFIV